MKTPIVAFGDWHANVNAAIFALENAKKEFPDMKKAIHVGDFGFWPADVHLEEIEGYVYDVNETLEELDVDLYVCLGNHEHYGEIAQTYGYHGAYCDTGVPIVYDSIIVGATPGIVKHEYTNKKRLYCTGYPITDPEAIIDEDGFICSKTFPRIKIIPRAHTWNWGGIQFASLGGANSIDALRRIRWVSWWEQESIHPTETRSVIELCAGKNIDVMITHDAPISTINSLYGYSGHIPGDIREWANRSGSEVQTALVDINPRHLICGHHHRRVSDKVHGTKVEILNSDSGVLEENRIEITSLIENQ